MNKFYWKKIVDTTDLALLKYEVIQDLKTDLINAVRNKNNKRAAFIQKEIEKIEQLKDTKQ